MYFRVDRPAAFFCTKFPLLWANKEIFYVYNSIMIICMLPIFRYDCSKVNENTIVLVPI